MKLSVPGTGFEPAHPCERCHLKAVRLPISPPGLFQDGKDISKTEYFPKMKEVIRLNELQSVIKLTQKSKVFRVKYNFLKREV